MVLTSCWRCLRLPPRLLNTPATRVGLPPLQPRSAPFTTASVLLANPPKKQNTGQGNQKAIIAKQKTTSNKFQHKRRKKDIVLSKPAYAAGQRKILRKNIVLSNTNAPAIPLPEMSPELCGKEDTVGTVFEIPGSALDQLLALQAFKLGQHWRYFQKPSALVRPEGVEIGKLISWISEQGEQGEERYARRILDGLGGSGKTTVLTQAMTWALQHKWVVISIPNAQDLVIGHTEYEFDPTWDLWVQKEYTSALLGRIATANHGLKNLETSGSHKIGKDEVTPPTLDKLVNMGIQEPTVAHDVFMALLKELGQPGRPPVLFVLDNLSQISLPSAYRDVNFAPIHAHDLAVPHTFLSYLSGKSKFPRGLTLAATSSVCGKTKDLDLALRRKTAGPWDKVDERIAASIDGADVIRITKLTREEVRILMEWYSAGGILNTPINMETVTEKYVISCGNQKELFSECLRLKY